MVKPLLGLLLGSLASYGVAVAVAPTATLPAAYGLGITLPPALVSLTAVVVVAERWPLAGPTAVIAGTGLRMAWALVAVSLLGRTVEKVGIPRDSLAEWTCGFYLVTLALETAALWGRLARTGRPRVGPPV